MSETGPAGLPPEDRPEDFDDTHLSLRAAEVAAGLDELSDDPEERFRQTGLIEDLYAELGRIGKDRADFAGMEGRAIGEIAAEDPARALELLGGEEGAREKIGDEHTDELLRDIEEQRQGEHQ